MAKASSSNKREVFSFFAPEAQTVALVGDFSGWEQSPVSLKRLKNGLWKATVSLAPGTYEYRFLVDGQWCNDPQCEIHVPNPYGAENCVREVRVEG